MVSRDPVQVLNEFGTEYNAEILAVTSKPLSADEISELADVPIGTTYRRIDDLIEADLLELTDRVLSDHHRRRNVYQRSIDSAVIQFEGDSLSVDVEERSKIENKLDDVWRTLSDR